MKRMIPAIASGALACAIVLCQAASPGALPSTSPVLPPSPAVATSPTADQVLLEFDVYRVSGNASLESAQLGQVEVTISESDVQPRSVVFFDKAKLTAAGVELVANNERWTWNGIVRPPENKRIQALSSPRVVVACGNTFEIQIVSQPEIEYFEKRSDGLFELKKLSEETGLRISPRVVKTESDRIRLENLAIRLRSIEAREPIEGLSLDVGRPIIRAFEATMTVEVEPKRYYGILLGTEGYGFLLVRLRVSPFTEETSLEDGGSSE
jgi:hypothetical protein